MRLKFLIVSLLSCPGGVLLAQDEVLTEESVQALERFYGTFNGDQWRDNDGWLDPGVDPCDWHGVNCGFSNGAFVVTSLELPDNNLDGPWQETDIHEHVARSIRLPGNAIHGSLDVLPIDLDTIDLSDNQLTGNLPPRPDTALKPLDHLNLARNAIGGSIPDNWFDLELIFLDLSNNRLEGSLEPLAFAGRWQGNSFMNLADNQFGDQVPAELTRANLYRHNDGSWGGGINLCWNELETDLPGVKAWLDERHVGGENYPSCLKRARLPIDRSVSGSWFDPERNGEGISLQLLPDGRVLQYTFGFDNQGRQHWLFGVGSEASKSLHWRDMISTRGIFGVGEVEPDGPAFTQPVMGWGKDWRMDRVGEERFQIERTYHDSSDCPDGSSMLCFGDSLTDRLEYTRLTHVAGTSCDNQRANQWISGAWYDPSRNGEGFVVEVLPDGRGVVYWFTYEPGDSRHQAWMIGVGEFDGQTLQVSDVVRPVGGRWGDAFDPADVVFESWGSLTLEFFDNSSGRVAWDSVQDGFGSGAYAIKRLSSVRLADCGS